MPLRLLYWPADCRSKRAVMSQIANAAVLASILSIVVLSTVMTFRYAGHPDLSVDGVFALGGAAAARTLLAGGNVVVVILVAAAAGLCAGAINVSLSQRLRINALLASVLLLIVLHSVNLRILGGPNRAVFQLRDSIGESPVTVIFAVVAGIFCAALFVFRTELGAAMRAVGQFPLFLASVGRDVMSMQAILVASSGALVAIAGALMMLYVGFADVTLGTGMLIVAIASLIAGEKLLGRVTVSKQVLAAALGTIVYQAASSSALALGLQPVDVKLATGILAIAMLATRRRSEDNMLA
jgi:putative ABC transport system permease protein